MPRQTAWCLRYGRWKSTLLVFCVYLLIGGLFYPKSAIAGGRIIKEDTDNDGKTDRILHLAPSGDVVKLEADTNGDLKMDTFQYYERGVVVRFERDTDADGHIDERDFLKNGKRTVRQRLNLKGETVCIFKFDDQERPLEWQRDTNGDGDMDTIYQYKEGKAISKEEDTNHDGRMDRFTTYDDRGRPLCLREFEANEKEPVKTTRFKEGEIYSVKQIDNGRVVFTRFENKKPVKQTIDEDGDGQPEKTITFDKNGLIKNATIDTNRDGRNDAWQHYAKGVLYSAEQDRDHDGKVDARFWYEEGKLSRSLFDENGDGHFETLVRFDAAKWTKVMETVDKEDRIIERLYFIGEVVRKKELFDPAASCLVKVEEFNEDGKIVLSKEAENGSSLLDLTWHYDADENPVMAEKDTDGDGKTDVWYYYKNGCITKVEEDRNRDGKPDLWEDYDSAQVVVRRSEDLDFDGTADIERRF